MQYFYLCLSGPLIHLLHYDGCLGFLSPTILLAWRILASRERNADQRKKRLMTSLSICLDDHYFLVSEIPDGGTGDDRGWWYT